MFDFLDEVILDNIEIIRTDVKVIMTYPFLVIVAVKKTFLCLLFYKKFKLYCEVAV